ncbi:MAG: glycosyltransferase [bacterium]
MTDFKKSILMITSRADYGGGPEHIYLLIKNISAEYKIFIAAPDDKPYWKRFSLIVDKSAMIKIPHRKFRIRSIAELRTFIIKNNIDIIHSHGKGAGIYGRCLSMIINKPCIHTFHGVHKGEYNIVSKYLYIALEKFLSCFTYRFISVSKSEAAKIKEIGLSGKKIEIIPNGIEIPTERINDKVFEQNILRILTVTRFDYAKNTGLIINIFDSLLRLNPTKIFHFDIIGSGELESAVKMEIENYNWKHLIHFHGFQNNLTKFYLNAFCYLSTSRWEGLPLSLMEAMSFGVPAVVSEVAGNCDLVDETCGFLYNLGEPETAAQRILELSEDRNLWSKFSSASFEKISRNFTIQNSVNRTLNLYLTLKNTGVN